MEEQLIKEIRDYLDSGQSLSLSSYFILFIVMAIASYLGTYLREKGRNLATKEDIAAITEKVEEVRTKHAKHLETYSLENRLRLASLDKRLEIHQKAYTLWLKLLRNVHNKEKLNDVVIECQNWWYENCLYLSENARTAFNRAYLAAPLHRTILDTKEPGDAVNKNWDLIESCGEIILKSAGLPSFGEGDLELIKEAKEKEKEN